MQKHKFLFPPASRSRGSALLIVLAFLILLTTLTVAFLSRATMERQLSNSSYGQNKTDLVAQGSIASILADLQQEIVAGSNGAGTPTMASGYYYPTSPLTAPPAVAVPAYTASSLVGTGMENLVKVSKNGQAFWPTSNYTAAGPSRASPINTYSNPSLNNRSVTAARWNAPLLVARNTPTSTTDYTPVTTFPIPDWIYVARDGTNPTTWNSSYQYLPNIAPTTTPSASAGANPITQRYAYVIYDEGGTLDMNVAASPVTGTSGSPATVTYSATQPYKNALAYADITQLPYLSLTAQTVVTGSSTTLTAAQQTLLNNAIVGWRNNFSAYVTAGSFPGTATPYTFKAATSPSVLTPFDQNMIFNPSGFLSMGGMFGPTKLQTTSNAKVKNGTDNAFSTRQQLIQFFMQGLGQNTTFTSSVPLTALINVLQYLGTFSRDINQPSYAPSPAKITATPTAAIAAGGNDKGATGADAAINPAFLATAVTAAFNRNDGSLASIGEPLVKKRFALSRLAWLTAHGPIANDAGQLNPASDTVIASVIASLENNYGYSPAFLSQGGPTAIYKYFGLSWVTDSTTSRANGDSESKWVYNHEQNTYPTSLATATGTVNPIRTLASGTYTVVSKQREPDFFELLKASITLGSLGKAYSYSATASALTPAGYQQLRDNSVDLQILQIGANIIDQFQPSGYCARILFTDGLLFGGTIQEVRGIEDMPYIYRMREGKITVTDSVPSQATCPTTSVAAPSTPGQVAVLQEPEVWNPHAWNVSATDTLTRPTSFRIVAISTDPNSASSTAVSVTPTLESILNWAGQSSTPYTPSSPNPAWNETSTELDFNIPQNTGLALFREPTLLIKPGVPTNSGLAVGPSTLVKTTFPAGYVKALWPSTQILTGNDNKQYIGFLMGTGPAAWSATIPAQGIDGTNPTSTSPGVEEATYAALLTTVNGITYRMQYLDTTNNWVTYDEKYLLPVNAYSYNNGPPPFWTDQNKTFNVEGTYSGSVYTTANNNMSQEIGEVGFDPRSSRFGMQFTGPCGYRGQGDVEFPVRMHVPLLGWIVPSTASAPISNFIAGPDIKQMALMSERPDQYAGFNFDQNTGGIFVPDCGPTALGWYPSSTAATFINPGMFTQNDPAEVSNPTNMQQVRLDGQTVGGTLNQFFADADGVVRRGMASWVPTDAVAPADPAPAGGQPWGLPMKVATSYPQVSGSPPVPDTSTNEYQSRPIMLNRPFRSVADLGYVFTGTPWRNLDVTTPESGSSALLDIFCINDTNDPNGLVAGKINLNTRQASVVNAVLAGSYTDEFSPNVTTTTSLPLTSSYSSKISAALIARTQSTTTGQGPLENLSELVGKWNSSVAVGTSINGSSSYLGFSSDLTTALTNASATDAVKRIQRFRAAPIRALVNNTTSRVWNLMIDVIAQTGRFPTGTTSLANFNVEGERRYWVHVAIDRYTGKVLDEQAEEVKE